MKKGALVKLIDVNGEERGHGLFMDSFIPAERAYCVRHDHQRLLASVEPVLPDTTPAGGRRPTPTTR